MESIEVGPSDLLSQCNSSLTVMAVGSLKEGARPGSECEHGEDRLGQSGGEEDALQRRPGENDGDLDEDQISMVSPAAACRPHARRNLLC